MPVLKWKDEYSVGVVQIDGEHQNLLEMINYAYDSVVEGREKDVLVDIVADMKAYAAEHFTSEEGLMRQYNYPKRKEHKALHDDFIIKAATTDKKISMGQDANPTEIFKFLADWLRDHILGVDKEFASYLHERGVK